MVKPKVSKESLIDFSFMPSLQCDLTCAHCMYNSSPFSTAELDFLQTKQFTQSINWDLINSCGFYGGEPGINLDLYGEFIDLIPKDKPRFTITDGTWSKTEYRTRLFVDWANTYNLQVFISTTKHHKPYQDLARLRDVVSKQTNFILKGDDTIIPMGRAATKDWRCTFRCTWDKRPIRFALKPIGTIIFQTCDGIYPVVGTYLGTFNTLLHNYRASVDQCISLRK